MLVVGCDAYSHLEVDKASSIGIFSTTCCTDFQLFHKMPITAVIGILQCTVSYDVVARIGYWVKLASTVDGYYPLDMAIDMVTVDMVSAVNFVESDTSNSFR